MNDELISIITPTYNRGYILKKAIECVINQSCREWEWIIIDDASSDDTEEIVSAYSLSDLRIRYVKNHENKGANACRNQGVALAQGQYLAFLDSDNQWEPDKLRKQIEVITKADSNVGFVYSKEKVIDGDHVIIQPKKAYDPEELQAVLMQKNVVDTSTALVRKSSFQQVGGFDENMPRLQDWELFFRLVVSGYNGFCINEILNTNILQQDSISKDDKKFVDAIFYAIQKHKKYFNETNAVAQKIFEVIKSTRNQNAYILQKYNKLSPGDFSVMAKILDKITAHTESIGRENELLCSWKKRDEKQLYRRLAGKKTAIYGLGKWGELLYEDLRRCNITLSFGIDREIEQFHGFPVYTPDKELCEADVIIIAVIGRAMEIKKPLKSRFNGEIYLLEELINGVE